MNGLQGVLQRINSIEQRFGIKHPVQDGTFVDELSKATHGDLRNASTGDVKKMLSVAAQKYGVDLGLVQAVAQTESGLSQNAVSSVGAKGVMQLMPDTAKAMGVGNINDPRENIDGGVRYLKQMLSEFDGDVSKALAAYNAGPEAVKKYNGIPPYNETRNYVNKVLSIMRNTKQ